jgi:Fe-S cluster assembly protein SufD
MNTAPSFEDLKINLLSQIDRLNGDSDAKKSSLSKAEKLTFPGSKNEEWKYSPFVIPGETSFALGQTITKKSTRFSRETDGDVILLVFLDGSFSRELSDSDFPNGFTLQEIQEPKTLISGYEDTIFSHLNDATSSFGGIEIKVEPKVQIEKTIVFLHIQTDSESAIWSQPRVQIEIGNRSEVSFAEFWQLDGNQPLVINAINEVEVGDEAIVSWLNFENGKSGISMVNQTRVKTGKKAMFKHVVVSMGEGFFRNNLEIHIEGEHGDAHMYGLTLGNHRLHVDHHTFINHKPENTTSNQLYKGIYGGKSTGVFNGKILVDQAAQKTNAYQSSKNILLSPDAKMYAKPQLEIFADDVKCSHGATIGQLDEEPVFYLRSRGLDLATARMLLVQAFASEILFKIENQDLRNFVEKEVLSEMDRMTSN